MKLKYFDLIEAEICFHKWNKKYFKSKLPKIPIVFTKGLQGLGYLSFARQVKPRGDDVPHNIQLAPWLKTHPSIGMLTLFHEMAHLGLWQKGDKTTIHGPKFQGEMRRLANEKAFDHLW